MRRPISIVRSGYASIIALTMAAAGDAGALHAQGGNLTQEFAVTETQLETYAQHGRSREEVETGLGHPLSKDCRVDLEVWTYRVDGRRVQLLFQEGALSLTIFGKVTLEG